MSVTGLSAEMWYGWSVIMSLGVAALLSTSFEWWAFEIGVFLSGKLIIFWIMCATI